MFAAVGTRTHFLARVRITLAAALVLLALVIQAAPAAAAPPNVASSVGIVGNNDTAFHGLTITPDGGSATITFTTNQAVRAGALYAIAGVTGPLASVVNTPIAPQPAADAAPTTARASIASGAAFTESITLPSTSHTIRLTGLRSNTVYTATIWIADGAGQQTQGTAVTFHTPKQRIRITFPKATITDYAQLIGHSDALWILNVRWAGGDFGFKSTVQVKMEVFYDDLSYAGSKTVTDPVGGKTVVSLFT